MEYFKSDNFIVTIEEISKNLDEFIQEYGTRTNFKELNEAGARNRVWERLFDILDNPEYKSTHTSCLAVLRILSRDKTGIDELANELRIKILLKFSHLDNDREDDKISSSSESRVEALKLLCNLIYNSQKARNFVVEKSSCLSKTVQRISEERNELTPEDILFHMRILFLVTALCPDMRNFVKTDLNADIHLTEILADISERSKGEEESILKTEDVNIACEILKVLFNLFIRVEDEESDEKKYEKLVSILYDLLISKSVANQYELKSHIVNLLTVVPTNSYAALIPNLENGEDESTYRNADMRAVLTLLDFLNKKLDSETDLAENVSPITTALIKLTKAQRLARKFIRLQILPPLKDVMKRPEEGTTIRAKLCKQLTSPHTNLRDLVAELIFILCKENVGRMVKYTGYGNAAGMFANKGLLGGRQVETDYSSESGDSDTDEYIKYKEQINPITGCYEKPKVNPLEGMSEERKEYEAVQLAQLMDKLTREGIVQPCCIGEDGKPKPIEHVLELQSDQK